MTLLTRWEPFRDLARGRFSNFSTDAGRRKGYFLNDIRDHLFT